MGVGAHEAAVREAERALEGALAGWLGVRVGEVRGALAGEVVHARAGGLPLRIEPTGSRGFFDAGGFVLAHGEAPGAGEAARALRARLGGRASEPVAAALAAYWEAARAPTRGRREALDGARAAALFAGEGALLAPWVDAFAAHYGRPLGLWWPERGEAGRPSLAFPDVAPEQSVFLRAPAVFANDARGRAYLADLGYGVDAGGKIAIVPLPADFARRRAALGQRGGFDARLVPAPVALFSGRRWLRDLAGGVLPINLYGRRAYALTRRPRALSTRLHPTFVRKWHTHFHALGHDMSLHALGWHRIGVAAREALLAEARRTLGLGLRARRAAARAAIFFEERLTRTCAELWMELDAPDAFEARFDAALPTLLAALRDALAGR
ncbi:MAG TPA: hypothetical protein RMH85_18060 [Polyangiaceae bacterium LLY-WYZ-15_(1-7)]|nr:hypothetical protein [Sandaracinus sp.]MBJ71838.1 hypothetical protein [Sandaracinus sp.]HJL04172.1 hypothetical protein [Polyangiaceae bacterium LLY-WYZ-15_(1-7)]HJL10410.1 hypothetical protein [Polyangiaceae bacterium LLY-WYZ-15_(1-7)]HJL36104.1 hypothetical protein [Polyangiaceae bacterium LLY-WYZ-15_(1-7)]